MKTLKQTGEFKFIAKIAKLWKKKRGVIKGIGDDAAVVNFGKGKFLLFTTDMLLEDVHFRRQQPPAQIGHKALACSISDIAAMGGLPKYALVSIGLPKDLKISFVEKIYQGIKQTAKGFGVEIIGGDTNCFEKIIIDVFLCGEVKRRELLLRSGAKKGDYIFLTGRLGGSGSGRHLQFTPRVKEAQFLVKNFSLNSMIDISDGLLQDLTHILTSSRAGAILFADKIPLAADATSLKDAYYDGEDFELLFTLSKPQAKELIARWPFKAAVPLSCIGEIVDRKFGLKVKDKKGKIRRVKISGYQHFK